jgi:hypothetical protein
MDQLEAACSGPFIDRSIISRSNKRSVRGSLAQEDALDIKMSHTKLTPLLCNNQGVLKLAKNPIFHEHARHVEIHCHFIKQLVEDGSIELHYYPMKDQTTDIFTKSLGMKNM